MEEIQDNGVLEILRLSLTGSRRILTSTILNPTFRMNLNCEPGLTSLILL